MSEAQGKAKSIFLNASDLASEEERLAYVVEQCGGDAALRREVDDLLRHREEIGSFMEPVIDSPTINESDFHLHERPGKVIGPYKLLQLIGEGGMGVVFLAEQQRPVRRQVALKVIKAGMDTRQVVARFESERQALALMDHPNIAKVLDARATDTGRPYFVMELVKGIPITTYCDQRRLTPRDRLGLFVQVCQAVQHAHQKGIIHRDLKPSNVLIALYDGKPVPKVIDFGVAKATGGRLTEHTAAFTGFGSVVGTPEYMSPEQAELNQLDVDTRSDVYSLGVILYELLTGSTPIEHKRVKEAALLEVLRVVREQDPPRPSTRLSTTNELASIAASRGLEPRKLGVVVRGELDWIVMKALEKDRTRRYETANGFALDVQRYLADEAVQACPPTAGYRLRKFARRNKGGLAVAALVLFFLVLLGGGVGWAVRDRAAREAEAGRQQAERQGKVAGQVELIFAEVDRHERQQKWPEALSAARQAKAALAGGDVDAKTSQRVRERLKDFEFIDRLEQIRMKRVILVNGQWNNTGVDREYGTAFRDYGVDVAALGLEVSIDRLKAHPGVAIPLAAALDDWVFVRREAYGTDAADWNRLVAVARAIDPDRLRDQLRASWGRPVSEVQDDLRRLADSFDVRLQHPATVVSLARTLQRVNQSEASIRILRDAQYAHAEDFWLNLELGYELYQRKDFQEATRYFTAALSIRPNSVNALNNLGTALGGQAKLNEVIACCRTAIELDPQYAPAHYNLGNALTKQHKLDEAVAAYKRAIELEPGKAFLYYALGIALSEQEKLPDAMAAYQKAIQIDPNYANAHMGLGALYCDKLRDYAKAIECFRKAIALDPNYAYAHNNLGIALRGQKKFDEAVFAFRKAIELQPKYSEAYFNLGMAFSYQSKLDEAIDAYRKAIELDPKDATAYASLAAALGQQGKLDDAIIACRKAIELNPKSASAQHNLGMGLSSLAWDLATNAETARRDPGRAVSLAKEAVELMPQIGNYWTVLGAAHYRAGDWKAAIAALEESMKRRQGGDSVDWFFLAMTRWQLGEKDKAREWYDRAVERMDKNQPKDEALRRFRAEAAELLELKKKKN